MIESDSARRPLVVISDARHGRVREEESVFGPLGADLRVADCRSPADIAQWCAEADAVLLDMAPMDASAIAALKRCKVISRYGVGLDNVDQDAAAKAGIAVLNVPGYCDEEVAEHALALLLSLVRGIPVRDRGVRAGKWNLDGPQGSVAGSTVGVVGFGGSGKAFCRMVLALKPAELIVWSPSLTPESLDAELGPLARLLGVRINAVSFGDLLTRSDAISVHLKLVAETRGMFGAEAFSRCKRGAFFVNTSRGQLVDENALADALEAGTIAGAGLDVFEREPPLPGNRLLARTDTLFSDHSAYRSERSVSELKRRCAENAARALGLMP